MSGRGLPVRLSAVVALAAAAGIAAACQAPNPVAIRGSGTIRTEQRQVSGVQTVSVAGSGLLTIRQGAAEALTVTADDNLLSDIRSDVSGGELRLGPRDGVSISPSREIHYDLTVVRLSAVALAGSVDLDWPNASAGDLRVQIDGSGHGTLDGLTASSLEVVLNGSGALVASGRVTQQTVTISGSGSDQSRQLASQTATVSIAGSGQAVLNATDHLDVSISGSGHVSYAGSPAVTQRVTGSGSVTRVG